MDWYTTVKRHFDAKRYSPSDVAKFVVAGKITEDQFAEITGNDYDT